MKFTKSFAKYCGIMGLVIAVPLRFAESQLEQSRLDRPEVVSEKIRMFQAGIFVYRDGDQPLSLDVSKKRADTIAVRWIDHYNSLPTLPSGLQLVPMATLQRSIGQDQASLEAYDRRLAMVLTDQERAYTLETLITSFADHRHPERLASAKRYLPSLVAMQDSVATRMFSAYAIIAQAHFYRGERDSTALYAEKALDLMARLAFPDLEHTVFSTRAPTTFLLYASATAGAGQGGDRIREKISLLRAYAKAPPGLVMLDSSYSSNLSKRYERTIRGFESLTRQLGTSAKPIVATHWFNRDVPDDSSEITNVGKQLSLNDGIIRMIVFGNRSCGGCVVAAKEMQSMFPELPSGIELVYVTHTEGNWGVDLVAPEDEAQHLYNHYVKHLGYQYTIALWAGPKGATYVGGRVPVSTPNARYYTATPTIIITDGKGIIRHYLHGYSESMTPLIVNILTSLSRESIGEASR